MEFLQYKYDEVKTNRNSAYGSAGSARPWSAEEIGHLQAYVNRGYGLFRQRVADGRKMKTEEVEKIAQGRVWLGTDAKSIKLIDGFGSLDDAVAKAAQLAKVSDYGTTEYPMPADWIDQLLDLPAFMNCKSAICAVASCIATRLGRKSTYSIPLANTIGTPAACA